jgi:ankyrin repeat protein
MKGADSGILEAVEILLKAGANPRFKAPTGWTALLLAARKGHADIVQTLLNHGADPNDQNVFAAHTPLILAAMGNYEEVVRILLEAGADLKRKNQWGRTALSHARPKTEIWKILIEAGAEE